MAVSVIAYKCGGLVWGGKDTDLIHFNPIYTDFFLHIFLRYGVSVGIRGRVRWRGW